MKVKSIFYVLFFVLFCTDFLIFPNTLKILHISFHRGCINELSLVAEKIGLDLTSLFIPDMSFMDFDGKTQGNVMYNIGHERAENVWNRHKDYFNQFNVIITSDTVPLSRIFLQNKYEGDLIIWVCNRIDYYDQASLDCDFPDEEYYQLLADAYHNSKVHFISYNPFEIFYALQKNVTIGENVIKPTGMFIEEDRVSIIPLHIKKENTFFVPPYLNDASTNVMHVCEQLGIKVYRGRYNGVMDLKDFKGIIHVPYAWSNFAFFENMQADIPYFIPTQRFMTSFFKEGIAWWPNGNYFEKECHLAEWFNKENEGIITYFDSWEDLKQKIESINFDSLRSIIKKFAKSHCQKMLEKWTIIFDEIQSSR